MKFDFLSNRTAAEQAIRDDLLRRQIEAKERNALANQVRARAAGIQALSGSRESRWRYGPEGFEAQESLRRFPTGMPEEEAATAKITATGYAESVRSGAKTSAGRLDLDRERFEYGKRFLEGGVGMPGSPEAEAAETARIKKMLNSSSGEESYNPCPEGFTWNGNDCVPKI